MDTKKMESREAYERGDKKTKSGQAQKRGNSRSTQGRGHLFSCVGSDPYQEAQTLNGTSRHYTMPLLNLLFKGLLRLYQKTSPKLKNCSCLWGPQVYETPAQTGFCIGKSNWDTDNLRAVKDLNGELQQTSGKCKWERNRDKKGKKLYHL